MRLCVFICSFYAKNALCSYEFEDSFDVCGKYGNGSLHLHGVKAVRLGSVISKNMLEFRILRLYLVSLSGLVCHSPVPSVTLGSLCSKSVRQSTQGKNLSIIN